MLARMLLLSLFLFFSSSPLLGQERTKNRTTENPSPGTATLGTGGRPAAQTAAGRSVGPRPSTVSPAPLPAGSSSIFGGGLPVQTFTPSATFRSSDWYRCGHFLNRLHQNYRFLPVDHYYWRYAQGDSPITATAVRLALQDSVKASDTLIDAAEHLDLLIQRYEAGQVSHEDFEAYVKSMSKRIRDLAKDVRKDRMVDYLDLNEDQKVPSYQRAGSMAEIRELTHRLRARAAQMNRNLTALYEEDMTRVVEVSYLERPSVDSISKEIDRIAKTIEKSAGDL